MDQPKVPPSTSTAALPHQRLGLFSTFRTRPLDVTYEDQDPNEEIILFLRRDFITNVPWIVISLIAIAVPPLLFILQNIFFLFFIDISGQLLFVLVSFYYLVVAGYAITNFLDWFYNISMVTTKKMIDVQFTIGAKNVANALLQAIEEVEYKQKGFLGEFFDYGDVIVQTKAEIPNFDFISVPRPARVVDTVTDMIPNKVEE